jgi:hypothetical protein
MIVRLDGADPEDLLLTLRGAREFNRRQAITRIEYHKRPEVIARKAEIRAAKKAGIEVPRKTRTDGYGNVLGMFELELIRTLPYEDLPVPLKQYVDDRKERLSQGDILTDEDKMLIETIPQEELPLYLKENLDRHRKHVVTYEEAVLMLTTPSALWPVELRTEVIKAVEDKAVRYARVKRWKEDHPDQDLDSTKEAQKRYAQTPKGIEARRRAQRNYQARVRAAYKLLKTMQPLPTED